MVPKWVQSQHTAFVRWCNMHLNGDPVVDVSKDFADGVRLCKLVEMVTKRSVGKYNAYPKHLERFENVGMALECVRHDAVKLDMIGAEDFVEGNLKMILGFIWQLIVRYTVSDIQQDGVSARDGLLLWCARKTSEYDIKVRDFSASWQDGLALCAIMDHYRPDLLEFDELNHSDPLACIEAALDAANEVGIPRLLDPTDILEGADDKSLVTYLAYWYHAFSSMDQLEAAGRRLEKFTDIWSIALKMKREYEKRIQTLLASIKAQKIAWAESPEDVNIAQQFEDLQAWRSTLKRQWVKEKIDVVQLFGNIRVKLATYGLAPYTPRRELAVETLHTAWQTLLEAENAHAKKVLEWAHREKEMARQEFAAIANEISGAIHILNLQVSALDGELDTQLVQISKQSAVLNPLSGKLQSLKASEEKCRALKISANEYTTQTFEDVEFELRIATQAVAQKLAFIENQMVARDVSNVTPALLDDFETVFRHFDRSSKNKLSKEEFLAALASLGISFSTNETDQIWQTLQQNDLVSFKSFIVFLISVTKDQNSLDQVRQSFREIAANKDYITVTDLENALLTDETIEQLTALMPKCKDPEGYDYKQYLENINNS